jgi:DNA-binding beta-propeller fold protein YncE
MRIVVALLAIIASAGLLPSTSARADCLALEQIATIQVGAGPREVVVDSGRQRVYVANSEATTVSVIDGQSLRVVNEWPLTNPIRAMALDPTTSRLYLAYDIGDRKTELWAVDAESGQHLQGLWFLWTVKALAVNPSLQRVYLAGELINSGNPYERLSVVDGDVTQELHALEPSGGLTNYTDVAVDGATGNVYAAHHYKYPEQSYVAAFSEDLRTTVGIIEFRESSAAPDIVMIDSLRRRALLTMGGRLRIVDISTAPGSLSRVSDPPMRVTSVRVINPGSTRLTVAFDEIAGIVFAAASPYPAYPGGRVFVQQPVELFAIDVMSAREIARIPLAAGSQHRLAVDSAMHRVYVTNENDGTVSVFRGFASPDTPAC